jgi:hypothetical protein
MHRARDGRCSVAQGIDPLSRELPPAIEHETSSANRSELNPGSKPKRSLWDTIRNGGIEVKYIVEALAKIVGIALLIAVPVAPVVALLVSLASQEFKQPVLLGGVLAYMWLVGKAFEKYAERLDAETERIREEFRRAQEEEARRRGDHKQTAQERLRLEEKNYQGTRESSGDESRRSSGRAKSSASFILKSLYRKVALRFHPDHAVDDADRVRREEIMKEVNVAYNAGDIQALQRFLSMDL